MENKAVAINIPADGSAVKFYSVPAEEATGSVMGYNKGGFWFAGKVRKVEGANGLDELYLNEDLLGIVDRTGTAPVDEKDKSTFLLEYCDSTLYKLSIMQKEIAVACFDGRFTNEEAIIAMTIYYEPQDTPHPHKSKCH